MSPPRSSYSQKSPQMLCSSPPGSWYAGTAPTPRATEISSHFPAHSRTTACFQAREALLCQKATPPRCPASHQHICIRDYSEFTPRESTAATASAADTAEIPIPGTHLPPITDYTCPIVFGSILLAPCNATFLKS